MNLDPSAARAAGQPVRTPEGDRGAQTRARALAKALRGPAVERYRFSSASHAGVEYELTVDGADVTCSCPGFEYRGQCRHARELKSALAERHWRPADFTTQA